MPAITVVADFKAHHYHVARKLQKSLEPPKTRTTRQLPLIACCAIVLFFRPCVRKDILIDKLWLVGQA
ncbi:MAG: hypothetical protein RBR84_00010 [Bacteroidales bacterium]|nr:hypothetical protein [Bacteroidales bacterium]